jgi:hypothetical protein
VWKHPPKIWSHLDESLRRLVKSFQNSDKVAVENIDRIFDYQTSTESGISSRALTQMTPNFGGMFLHIIRTPP